jgi:putative hydrolase of the HAD superfamily
VRAVTIDFWGTLVVEPPLFDECYRRSRLTEVRRVLAGTGKTVSLAALDRAYDALGAALAGQWVDNRDLSAEQHVRTILDAIDRTLLASLPAATVGHLVEAYARPAALAPPVADPAAASALDGLRACGYTLGVVSNTMRTPGVALRRVLEHHGLLPFFSALTFSDEWGVRKPDPAIFALTLRALSVSPAEAIHVGDDPVLDVEGARAAGMRVIRVTRDPTATDDAKADATIANFSALLETVQELDGRP